MSRTDPAQRLSRPWRWILLGLGHTLFLLGAIGLFLPIMPTTIFWIGAAFCFARSSPAMQQRIYATPRLGPIVRDWVEDGVASRTTKAAATAGLALTWAMTALVATGMGLLAGLGAILSAVALYVWTRPERKA